MSRLTETEKLEAMPAQISVLSLPAQCFPNSASRQRLSDKSFPFHSAFSRELVASWDMNLVARVP